MQKQQQTIQASSDTLRNSTLNQQVSIENNDYNQIDQNDSPDPESNFESFQQQLKTTYIDQDDYQQNILQNGHINLLNNDDQNHDLFDSEYQRIRRIQKQNQQVFESYEFNQTQKSNLITKDSICYSDKFYNQEEIGKDVGLLRSTVKKQIFHSFKKKKHQKDNIYNEGGDFDSIFRNSEQVFELTSYRWYQLAIFSFAVVLNQVAWISLQPIASDISKYYDVSDSIVNTMSLIYQAFFILFTFPSNYVIDELGCRKAILFGSLLTTLGMITKVFINQNFWICVVGQVFAAIGQPFLLNAPTKLAAVWFGDKERVAAITIAVAASALGAAIGFLIPSMFVNNDDNQSDFKLHVQQSLLLQAEAGLISSILCIIFFKDKPLKPPSAQAFQSLNKNQKFKEQVMTALKDTNFLTLMVVFGQINGSFNTLGTIVGQVSSQFGFSDSDSSLFGALFIVGGITGSVIFGIWVEKTHSYKLAVFFISSISGSFTLIQYLTVQRGQLILTSILCFLQGIVMLPIMAVAFDFAVELTYPIGESYSTGILLSSGQFFGIIYTTISSKWIDRNDKQYAKNCYLMLAVACFVASVILLFLKQKLKRSKTLMIISDYDETIKKKNQNFDKIEQRNDIILTHDFNNKQND